MAANFSYNGLELTLPLRTDVEEAFRPIRGLKRITATLIFNVRYPRHRSRHYLPLKLRPQEERCRKLHYSTENDKMTYVFPVVSKSKDHASFSSFGFFSMA